jgi:EmrB/QacA subfamily drug resistance transporter
MEAIQGSPASRAAVAPIPWGTLAVVCLGILMTMVDSTIVNIAVPSIVAGLQASLDQVLWVINAYLVVYAVLLVPAGRLGDLYGQRNVFVAGLVCFTAASAACGFAQDAAQLIVARAFQGAGAGLLTPQALALITTATGEERRGFALGVFAGVTALAAIAGPILGGYIITAWSWHWIFEINVPVGLVAVAGSLVVLPGAGNRIRRGIDPLGMLLVGAGLLAVVFGLLEGQRYDWGTVWGRATIPEIIVAGVLLLGVFVVWERRHNGGLLPLLLLRRRNYALGNVVGVLVAFSMLGLILSVVLLCQVVLGLSALATGYALVPAFLGLLIAAPVSGRLTDRFGGKYPLLAGTIVTSIGFVVLIRSVGIDVSTRGLVVPLAVIGIGNGLGLASVFTMLMAGIPEDMVGTASGFISATKPLGQALGTAVIGGVLQNRLVVAVHDQAVAFSTQLPMGARGSFVAAMSSAFSGNAHQLAAAAPSTSDQLHRIAHDVVTQAYVDAMVPTLAVALMTMLLAVLASLAMKNSLAAGR